MVKRFSPFVFLLHGSSVHKFPLLRRRCTSYVVGDPAGPHERANVEMLENVNLQRAVVEETSNELTVDEIAALRQED